MYTPRAEAVNLGLLSCSAFAASAFPWWAWTLTTQAARLLYPCVFISISTTVAIADAIGASAVATAAGIDAVLPRRSYFFQLQRAPLCS